MNRDNVRSTARSVANQEFHRSGEIMNEAAHRITRVLQDAGHRAVNPSATFPMEMDRFPGRIWVVAHKPVAVAAGLGVMGIHRNVIHPKFGNFILLGTVLVGANDQQLRRSRWTIHRAWNASCASRRARSAPSRRTATSTSSRARCTTIASSWAASPTGRRPSPTARMPPTSVPASAIRRTPRCGRACRSRPTTRRPTAWPSVPAGEDVIEPYLDDRKGFMDLVLKPLQEKVETLYVLPNSEAEGARRKRYPHKPVKGGRQRNPRCVTPVG